MLKNIIHKTVNSLRTPKLLFIILKSIIATAILLISFTLIVKWFFASTQLISIGWIDWIFDWISTAGATILAWFLFPILIPLIATLFLNSVATIIEKNDYPNAKFTPAQPLIKEIWHDIKFMLWALFLNILCLPLYFIPIINLIAYYWLNSHLLGREFFEMAGGRYIGKKETANLRKQNRLLVLTAGLTITLITNIPFINLIAPFIAIVIMVHLYHSLSPNK